MPESTDEILKRTCKILKCSIDQLLSRVKHLVAEHGALTMNLDIMELDGTEILWRYKGVDGVSTVTDDGTVQFACLCESDFDLAPGVGRKIIEACQLWYDARNE